MDAMVPLSNTAHWMVALVFAGGRCERITEPAVIRRLWQHAAPPAAADRGPGCRPATGQALSAGPQTRPGNRFANCILSSPTSVQRWGMHRPQINRQAWHADSAPVSAISSWEELCPGGGGHAKNSLKELFIPVTDLRAVPLSMEGTRFVLHGRAAVHQPYQAATWQLSHALVALGKPLWL